MPLARPRFPLFLLELEGLELERPAVLAHVTNGLVRDAAWDLCLDFEGDLDLRAELAGQVLDHFLGERAGVAYQAQSIDLY